MQQSLALDGCCAGPLFAPPAKKRAPVRPKGKEGVVHRAQTVRATPHWLAPLDLWQIKTFYSRAKLRTHLSGQLHVVDHIVPKISPRVCGLHVPWNLQILSAPENTSKANNWWPDMWAPQQELFE